MARKHWRNSSCACIVAIILTGASSAGAQPPAKSKPPRHLPEEIVREWKKVGAEPMWFSGESKGGAPPMASLQGKDGDLPVFRIIRVPLDQQNALPSPAVPFGLVLQSIDATDEHLKALKRFETLEYLQLHFTKKVTGEGIRALAELKKLKAINLGGYSDMDVTDEFLAILEKNRQLHLTTLAWAAEGKRPDGPADVVAFRWTPNVKLTAAVIPTLAKFPNLNQLSFVGMKVDDQAIATVNGFEKVKSWDFTGTAVTDAGVRSVLIRGGIESLSLQQTAVTDALMADLGSLKTLKNLNVSRTKVSDAGLAHLAKSESIEQLQLNNNPAITDAGLQSIATMKRLKSVNLSFTRVTDAGVAAIVASPELESLDLSVTAITDASLSKLATCKKLKFLNLTMTAKTTEAEVKKLQAALPSCQIAWGKPRY